MADFSFINTAQANIAAGAALSAPVPMYSPGYGIVRLNMPAAWTAAPLTFQVSEDNLTYRNLYDSLGNEVTVTAAAGNSIALDPTVFGTGLTYVKVRSGTNGSPVNQTAAAAITLIIRPL